MTILPELRAEVLRAAAAPARRALLPRLAPALAVAALVAIAVIAVARLADGGDDGRRGEVPAGPRSDAPLRLFERTPGPFDTLPVDRGDVGEVRRVVVADARVGYVSIDEGKVCVWGDLGERCTSLRQFRRAGLVTSDQLAHGPGERVTVAGVVPDRVRWVSLTGVRDGGDPWRLRVRDNAFAVTVPYGAGVGAYTLIERNDADQWSLTHSTVPTRDTGPLRACPGSWPAGSDWRVDGIECDFVGRWIRSHFEPHPLPYTIDAGGFGCQAPRQRRHSDGYRVTCSDGFRRFSFRFA